MAIDASRLGAGADAHEGRLRGPAWATGTDEGNVGDDFDRALAALVAPSATLAPTAPPIGPASPPAEGPDLAVVLGPVLARLDALSDDVAALRAAGEPGAQVDPLDAIIRAVGDPRAFDRPDARRAQVGVRFLPEVERAVQRVGERHGLRTRVGAWEYIVRIGLAVEARVERV
jgi:hypothetical protein